MFSWLRGLPHFAIILRKDEVSSRWHTSRRDVTRIAQGGAQRNPGYDAERDRSPRRGESNAHNRLNCAFHTAPSGAGISNLGAFPGFRCAPPWAILVPSLREERRPRNTISAIDKELCKAAESCYSEQATKTRPAISDPRTGPPRRRHPYGRRRARADSAKLN